MIKTAFKRQKQRFMIETVKLYKLYKITIKHLNLSRSDPNINYIFSLYLYIYLLRTFSTVCTVFTVYASDCSKRNICSTVSNTIL